MSQERKGLRVLTGLAGLFAVVGIAWFAQKHFVGDSRTEKSRAADLLGEGAGDFNEARTLDTDTWGHMLMGLPSGADPVPGRSYIPPARPLAETGAPPTHQPDQASLPSAPPRWPADLELVVRPGQSLSKIAAAEYGRATFELVDLLARYNNMSDANALRTGQQLRIPVREKLLTTK